MIELYFCLFVLTVGFSLFRGILDPGRIYQFSVFMAATFAIFILPQMVSLYRAPGAASEDAIEAVFLMSLLCAGACAITSCLPVNESIYRMVVVHLNRNKLFRVGVMFTFVGMVANYLMGQAAETQDAQWTGPVTIYHFFSMLLIPALAINLQMALTGSGWLAWACSLLAASVPIDAAIFYGRRETTAVLVLIIGLSLFYYKGLKPSRIVFVAVMMFATVAIPATDIYRHSSPKGKLPSFQEVNLLNFFESYLNNAEILELRNAAIVIESTSMMETYKFGTGYWDEIIWRFVPAQVVGEDLKSALMFRMRNQTREDLRTMAGYWIPQGTTITGVGDSFQQFGYFGALFFLIAGWVSQTFWIASRREGANVAQLVYMCTAASNMRAVTHQTVDYLPGFMFFLIFLGLGVYYARERNVGTLRLQPAVISEG
jgi:hypothetical protein